MNFFEYQAAKVWIDNYEINVSLTDGRLAKVSVKQFPLLANATLEQLNKFEIIGGYAIQWPELNEDLSIAGFFENKTAEKSNHAASLVS